MHMKMITCIQVMFAFILLVPISFADSGTDEVSSLLHELRDQSSSLTTMPTQAQQRRLWDLNSKLILLGKGSTDTRLKIRDELKSVMRVSEPSASKYDVSLYASYIMRDVAKIITPSDFLELSEEVVLSDKYRVEMRVDLLRLLVYELRGAYVADDLKPILAKASRLDSDAVSEAAIKMLVGWSIGSIEVSPVSIDEGIKVLEEFVEKHSSFESQQPYLEKLARLGHGRRSYVDLLRLNSENSEMPVIQRYKYATKLLEWDRFLVQELEKEMGKTRSKEGICVIQTGRCQETTNSVGFLKKDTGLVQ